MANGKLDLYYRIAPTFSSILMADLFNHQYTQLRNNSAIFATEHGPTSKALQLVLACEFRKYMRQNLLNVALIKFIR